MYIYILEHVEELTERYHCDGGLVIVGKSLDDAKKIVSKDKYIKPTDEEWNAALVYGLDGEADRKYFVFPDAGCC